MIPCQAFSGSGSGNRKNTGTARNLRSTAGGAVERREASETRLRFPCGSHARKRCNPVGVCVHVGQPQPPYAPSGYGGGWGDHPPREPLREPQGNRKRRPRPRWFHGTLWHNLGHGGTGVVGNQHPTEEV